VDVFVEKLRNIAMGLGQIRAAIIMTIVAGMTLGLATGIAVVEMAQRPRPVLNQSAQAAKRTAPSVKTADILAATSEPVHFLFLAGTSLAILATVIDFSGRVLCLAVPSNCRGASHLQASLALVGINLLFGAWSVAGEIGVVGKPPIIASMLTGMLSIVASILFMMFLSLMAEYIRRDDLGQRARSILNFSIMLAVSGIVGVFFTLFATIIFPPFLIVGLFGMLALGVLAIVLLVRYLRLLTDLRKSLFAFADALERSESNAVE
jgi:hypothetical protein